jgi:hypothetical protein
MTDGRGRRVKNAVVVEYDKFTARYYGGAYIDLYDNETYRCYDCINVWDYVNREPEIPHTKQGVRSAIADLDHDDVRLHPEMYYGKA